MYIIIYGIDTNIDRRGSDKVWSPRSGLEKFCINKWEALNREPMHILYEQCELFVKMQKWETTRESIILVLGNARRRVISRFHVYFRVLFLIIHDLISVRPFALL